MNYKLILLISTVTCVFSAPFRKATPDYPLPSVIPIVSQSEEYEQNGTYKFSYETGNGIKREETAYDKIIPRAQIRSSNSDEGGEDSSDSDEIHVQQGSYSYVAPDGSLITVRYIADENGFRPIGRISSVSKGGTVTQTAFGVSEKSGRQLIPDSEQGSSAPAQAKASSVESRIVNSESSSAVPGEPEPLAEKNVASESIPESKTPTKVTKPASPGTSGLENSSQSTESATQPTFSKETQVTPASSVNTQEPLSEQPSTVTEAQFTSTLSSIPQKSSPIESSTTTEAETTPSTSPSPALQKSSSVESSTIAEAEATETAPTSHESSSVESRVSEAQPTSTLATNLQDLSTHGETQSIPANTESEHLSTANNISNEAISSSVTTVTTLSSESAATEFSNTNESTESEQSSQTTEATEKETRPEILSTVPLLQSTTTESTPVSSESSSTNTNENSPTTAITSTSSTDETTSTELSTTGHTENSVSTVEATSTSTHANSESTTSSVSELTTSNDTEIPTTQMS